MWTLEEYRTKMNYWMSEENLKNRFSGIVEGEDNHYWISFTISPLLERTYNYELEAFEELHVYTKINLRSVTDLIKHFNRVKKDYVKDGFEITDFRYHKYELEEYNYLKDYYECIGYDDYFTNTLKYESFLVIEVVKKKSEYNNRYYYERSMNRFKYSRSSKEEYLYI